MAPKAGDQTKLLKRKREDNKNCSKHAGMNDNGGHSDAQPKIKKSKGQGKAQSKAIRTRPTHDPIMALPPELRLQIYEKLLISEHGGIPVIGKIVKNRHMVLLGDDKSFQRHVKNCAKHNYLGSGPDTSGIKKPKNLDPKLLLLNHNYHTGTKAILYGKNKFAMEDMRTLHAFCAFIGAENCAQLKHLSLRNCGLSCTSRLNNFPAFTILSSAINLTRLDIDCKYGGTDPQRVAKLLHSDAYYFLQAYGRANGRRDAAVKLFHFGPESVADTKRRTTTQGEKMAELAELNEGVPVELAKLLNA